MNDTLKKNRTVVSLAVFFLVIVPGFIFSCLFLLARIAEITDTIRAVKIDQEVNQNFLSSVRQLRASKENVLAKEENLSLLLESDASAKIALYGDIESIARSTGHSSVTNQIVDQELDARNKPRVNDPSMTESLIKPFSQEVLLVKISLIGTYENLLHFVHKIEHSNYLIDVQSIQINARVQQDENPRLRNPNQQENDAQEDPRDNLVDSNVVIAVYLDSLTNELQEDEEVDGDGDMGDIVDQADINQDG